jgi:hypothetical protein
MGHLFIICGCREFPDGEREYVEESYNEEKIQDAVMAFLDHGQPQGKHRAYLWAIYEFENKPERKM